MNDTAQWYGKRNSSYRSTSGFTFITEEDGLNCEGKAA